MPQPLQLKRNGTAAATPSSLLHGEVALNYADGKLFWKDASNVIQSFTFQAYALSSHTHAASDITSGTFDAARLPLATTLAVGGVIVGTGLGVSSGTVSVTYGTNSTSACRGDDSRLSDARTPTDGSVTTAKIANDAVTYAKIQNVSATDRILGRSSAGAGDVEEITCTAFGRSLIDDADAAAARTTLSVQPTASPAFTGAPSIINSGASDNSTIRYGNSGQNWYVGLRGDTSNVFAVADDVTFRFQINTSGVVTCFGQLLVTAGSASAPGVAVSGDTNTGMFSPSADVLAWATAGTERVRVDASGNVGIGGAPFYALDVQRTSANAVLNVQTTTSGNAQLRIECAGNASSTITQNRTSNNLEITNGSSGSIVLTNNGSERMSIASDGVVKMNDVYSDTVGATNRDLFIDDTGKLGYVSSIRASKTNIESIDDVSWLRSLTPVSFHYRRRNEDGTYSDEADGTLDYGLIAEDVEQVAPDLCFYDIVDGEPQLRGVHYSKLITPMLRYIQKLEQRIAALEERING